MPAQLCTVGIPVYKESPTPAELASFAQVMRVLGHYPMQLIAAEGLNTAAYERQAPDLRIWRLPSVHFVTTDSYSRLLLDPAFYEHFRDSEYLLIYQLDAWVFRDDLALWCSRGYSYVGAPWFGVRSLGAAARSSMRAALLMLLSGRYRNVVGNGGFSLRRVADCADAVRSERAATWSKPEDHFFSLIAPFAGGDFKVPRWREAAEFAFEINPSALSAAAGVDLPFGCHAWERYETSYWSARIAIPRMGEA